MTILLLIFVIALINLISGDMGFWTVVGVVVPPAVFITRIIISLFTHFGKDLIK